MIKINRWLMVATLMVAVVILEPWMYTGLYNSVAEATTIHVDDDYCPGPGSGIAGDPYCSIQTAIDAAVSGVDEVLVHDGTYVENINFKNKAITVRSENGAGSTTIDGSGSGSVVTFNSGEGSGSALDGFTITNGNASDGGGIYCSSSSPIAKNCIISGNSATNGGGIYCQTNSTPSISNCTISGNLASDGGGIYCSSSSPLITNCTFSGNRASWYGGGVRCGSNSNSLIVNSILKGDTAGSSGNEVYLEDVGSSITIVFSDIDSSNISGSGTSSLSNNINDDPSFVDQHSSLEAPTSAGNYHLKTGSPCIDVGTDDTVIYTNLPDDDIDGQSRPRDGDVDGTAVRDIGSDEYKFIHVDDDYPTPIHPACNDRTGAIDDPYCEIQNAIDAATSGIDGVLVHDGTYLENINFNGKAVTVRSENGADSTIIDGSNPTDSDLGSVVTFDSGEGSGSVLNGFTLTDGSGTDIYSNGNAFGGGIYCDNSSPTITNCIITSNTTTNNGGGIACGNNSSPAITNCTISNNTSSSTGGGIFCWSSSSPTITNCIIVNNSSVGSGGGIYCNSSSPSITNCSINGNTSGSGGGGIYCYSSTPAISSCTITGNSTTTGHGGAIFCSSSSPTITNCTITSNSTVKAYAKGGGIFCRDSSAPTVINSILWGNNVGGISNEVDLYDASSSIDITYSAIISSFITGLGTPSLSNNINANPFFINPVGSNYHLQTGSLCIDAANSNDPAPVTDQDGNPRYDDPSTINTGTGANGSHYDIGAYEYGGYVCTDNDVDGYGDPGYPDNTCPTDNCPGIANPDQADCDMDGIGDACDTDSHCSTDNDGDGVIFIVDNCPNDANAGQMDSDSDYFGDACDNCVNDANTNQADNDGDGLGDACDNCPNNASTNQSDTDGDNVGDICDNCLNDSNPDQADRDGDGIGNVCDPDPGPVTLHVGSGQTYSSIQAAIDAAFNGDTVLVHDGTYVENINFSGKAITVQSENGAVSTTIDGIGNGSVVTFNSGEGIGSVLEGFIITNGTGTVVGSDIYGGGIYCLNSSPTITSCVIINNSANASRNGFGGGIYCNNSSPTIEKCSISGNTATAPTYGNGGGIYCSYGSSPIFDNCTISYNTAGTNGGGIYCYYNSSLSINNCSITNNTAAYQGGGICASGPSTISNSTISNNTVNRSSGGWGGGIYSGMGHSATIITNSIITGNTNPGTNGKGGGIYGGGVITNCTITGNSATSSGGGIYSTSSNSYIVNTILWNNGSEIDGNPKLLYCDVQGGYPGLGNIDADPLFIDAVVGNYHLQPGSLCIDAGHPRILDSDMSRSDMGAYGGDGGSDTPITITVDIGGSGDYSSIQEAIDKSVTGDTITVLPGFYRGNLVLAGKEVSIISQDGAGSTIIDGSGSGAVVFFANVGPNAILQGFTIQDGSDNGISCYSSSLIIKNCIVTSNSSSGIYCYYSSPTITNCSISSNTAALGGGIYCNTLSSPIIINCSITDNTATHPLGGGGIICRDYSSPTIINCTIAGNTAEDGSGGGIQCSYNTSPTIINCIITANSSAGTNHYGGGIGCSKSSPTIANCIISNNTGKKGGGIGCYESSPLITKCTISGNYAGSGGGIFCRDFSSPKIVNSTISGNSSTTGGGIYCESSSPITNNCTISGNQASNGGGFICYNSSLAITNSTVSGNLANDKGGGIFCYNSTQTIVNTIFWGNTAEENPGEIYLSNYEPIPSNSSVTITFSDIDPSLIIGFSTKILSDNINSYPLFVNPRPAFEAPTTVGDYHLQSNSPCIDVATNDTVTYPNLPTNDIDDDSRPQGDGFEMGSDEYPCIDTDGDGVCDYADVCPGFDDNTDTDGDGVPDGCDACPGFDDTADVDGDGVPDGCDTCPGFDDTADADGDGVPNGCDICPNDAANDADGDGVCGDVDICPGHDDNVDTDNDGTPDGCDACPNDNPDDSDSDWICDSNDICPGFDDTADADGDGIPDGCDICPAGDDNLDADSDATPDACDTCTDIDNDGYGNPAYPANTCDEDCDDSDENINPDTVWYKDNDDDGYSDGTTLTQCTNPDHWQDVVDDTRLTSDSANSYYPSLGVDSSGNVHIAWRDSRDGNDEIYYTKLDNDGNTLVDDTRLTFDSASSYNSSLGVDSSGNVHIAWRDYRDGDAEIYYTKLDNDGNTLVDDTRLTYDGAGIHHPSLGVDSSGNVHIAWHDSRDGNLEIYYTKLDNDGNTLVDDTRLTSDSANSRSPSLGVDSSGNVHIAWYDNRGGYYDIYYTKLDNDGNTLVDDTRLTSGSPHKLYPSLGVDSSGNVHIAWRTGFAPLEIYYTKLDNDGNTLVDDTRLISGSANSYDPSLGVDSSGNVHIAWYDYRDGNYEIYYTKLDNDGNILVDDTRLTSDSANSYYHSLGVDSSGNIHIAWNDRRDGNEEIYYTKGIIASYKLDSELTATGGDCDDNNDAVHPDATEVCNGIDDNCVNGSDEGFGGDADGDGFGDACDICPGFDDNTDTDGDGVPDGCDICLGFDDAIDTDSDGIPDGCDICLGFDDSVDADGDGVPDGCDACPNDNPDDSDSDGICDSNDICPGFDDVIDVDGDGVPDGCDICPGFDDTVDTDSDGVPDGCDACPSFDDNTDTDSDGVPDGCDSCPNDADNDADGDGVCGDVDICPGYDDNVDTDSDGTPDGCDICPGFDDNLDADSDGVPDDCDICPGFDDNADADSDGVPDGCDICPGFDDTADADGDGVPDGCDACPGFDDTADADADADGVPDGCDICPAGDDAIDTDTDTVPNACDNCPDDPNTDQTDRDSDTIGDICDPDPGPPITIEVGSSGYDYTSIQAAIDASLNGDKVLVHDGTYIENINFLGKAIIVESENGAGSTTIDGNASGSVVTFDSGEGSGSILDGFTIMGGNGTDPGNGSTIGGGIYFNNSSSPSITNCDIYNNSANEGGGGIYCGTSSSPTIDNCTINSNRAWSTGGGIYCENNCSLSIANSTIDDNIANYLAGGIFCGTSSSPTIDNCDVNNNTAKNGGGIVSYESSSPVITNCTINSNDASYLAGGIGCKNSSPSIANCTISGNTALYGGGIGCGDNSSPTIVNCNITGNTASMYASGVGSYDSSPTIVNCTIADNTTYNAGGGMGIFDSIAAYLTKVVNSILWGDETGGSSSEIYFEDQNSNIDITYSDIQGGYAGIGNIGADQINDNPLFVDPVNGDYHLQSGSPCIDTGADDTVTYPNLPTDDIDGDSRPQDGDDNGSSIRDMGSDEIRACSIRPDNISDAVQNGTFTLPITITDAPDGVQAFTFDVIYDPQSLEYQSFQRGDLTQPQNYDTFSVTDHQDGSLTVSGYTAGVGIPQGSSGTVALLTFRTILNPLECTDVSISNLTGHMANWGSYGGEVCATESQIGDIDSNGCVDILDVLCLYLKVISDPSSCINNIDVNTCGACDVDGNWIFDIVMENVEAEAWEIILMSFKRLLLVRNSYLGWDIRGRDGPFYGDLLFDGIWRREKA